MAIFNSELLVYQRVLKTWKLKISWIIILRSSLGKNLGILQKWKLFGAPLLKYLSDAM
jgi:hypothetical protein